MMKHPLTVLCVAAVFAAGCSSSAPDRRSDEYFDPVRVTQVTKAPEGTAVPEFSAPSDVPTAAEPMLRQMMREQQRRMADLERRLASVETRQQIAETEHEVRRDLSPGEEALLAMIREQNLRLEEIMEQVRLMAERRERPPAAKRTFAQSRPPARASAKTLYASAIAAYQRGKYHEAEGLFRSALQGPIDASLADNCRFWLGVCRFQRKDLFGAHLALEPVSRDATSDKRTAAILMLGQVYEGMGKREQARSAYEQIVREHPRSSLRSVAERKLGMATVVN